MSTIGWKNAHWLIALSSALLAGVSAYMHANGPIPASAVAPLGLLIAVFKAMNMDPPKGDAS